MARFLIEIQHSSDKEGCIRALDAIVRQGSHMMTHAEFGCADGVHCGWIIVDVEGQDTARRMVPPQFREDARIVKLRTWNREEIEAMIEELES